MAPSYTVVFYRATLWAFELLKIGSFKSLPLGAKIHSNALPYVHVVPDLDSEMLLLKNKIMFK